MKQNMLAAFARYPKPSRRAPLLSEMDRLMPWEASVAAIATFFPKAGQAADRPMIPLEPILCISFLQLRLNLWDPAAAAGPYHSVVLRNFAGIDCAQERAPSDTTACKSHHLLERHKLGKMLPPTANWYLASNRIAIRNCSVLDTTIITALISTKNNVSKRDHEMRQATKGKRWHFGMKVHVVLDSRHKLIETPACLDGERVRLASAGVSAAPKRGWRVGRSRQSGKARNRPRSGSASTLLPQQALSLGAA